MNIKKILQAAKVKRFKQAAPGSPIIINSTGRSAFFMEKYHGYNYKEIFLVFTDDYLEGYYNQEILEKIGEDILEKCEKDPGLLKKWFDQYFKNVEENQINKKELEESVKLQSLNELTKTLLNTLKVQEEVYMGLAHFIESFALVSEKRLLAQINGLTTNKKLQGMILSKITTPKQKSFLREYEEEISKLKNSSNKDELIQKIQDKFYYIKNTYTGRRELTKKEIITDANHQKSIDAEEDYILPNDVVISVQTKELAKLISFVTYFQDVRKKNTLKGIECIEIVLEEISKKTNMQIGLLRQLLPSEISEETILNIKEKEVLLEKRKKKCIIHFSTDSEIIIPSEYIKTIEKSLNTESKKTDTLQGTAAALGHAIGVARVCSSLKEIDEFQEGEVLVASMTRPEYLLAMKKAVAFVTDEGGLTCHAAIVARELKKPCVIGTKFATQNIKTGDLVEVKADHGFVKILKRSNS